MSDSPYLFRADDHPLLPVNDRLKLREAVTGFGIALRYQERGPDPAGTPLGHVGRSRTAIEARAHRYRPKGRAPRSVFKSWVGVDL